MKDKELEDFLNKDRQKLYLEVFLILDELSRKYNILSFSFKENHLLVQVSKDDWFNINLDEE